MTVFVTLLVRALMLVIGLVVDGGAAAAARSDALDEATNAARAASQAVDEDVLRRERRVVLDPAVAKQDALNFIAATGDKATVTVHQAEPNAAGPGNVPAATEVTVTVTRTVSTQFLWAVGIDSISQSATATVTPEPGRLP